MDWLCPEVLGFGDCNSAQRRPGRGLALQAWGVRAAAAGVAQRRRGRPRASGIRDASSRRLRQCGHLRVPISARVGAVLVPRSPPCSADSRQQHPQAATISRLRRGSDRVDLTSSHRHPCANGHRFSMAMPPSCSINPRGGSTPSPPWVGCVSASLFPGDSP